MQADPIRAPATAQDLVLRHRVRGYRVGDLERAFDSLDLEEDYLYAYGFLARSTAHALHPRAAQKLTSLEKRIVAIVRERGAVHPSDVAAELGTARVTNAWGGQSRATTHGLERLRHRGMLRVARRERGVRVYELARERPRSSAAERLRTLVLAIVKVLAPISERTLHANIARLKRLGDPRAMVACLVREGALVREVIDGEAYVWPPTRTRPARAPRVVRFLAPFDPLVWDRRRFEHLWGWPYRFEAYTPASKRIRAYYALPLLYGDTVIGWASVGNTVTLGFDGTRPAERAFEDALEEEIVRIPNVRRKNSRVVQGGRRPPWKTVEAARYVRRETGA